MNAVLLDAYIADCTRIRQRWNREPEEARSHRGDPPPTASSTVSRASHAGYRFNPAGELIDEATWTKEHTNWLLTKADREYVDSCMVKVTEPGKFQELHRAAE